MSRSTRLTTGLTASPTSNRMSAYANLALAVSPVALGAFASTASADIHSQTGLNLTWGITNGVFGGTNSSGTLLMTGGGATFASINISPNIRTSFGSVTFAALSIQAGRSQTEFLTAYGPRGIWGARFVNAGATWNSPGAFLGNQYASGSGIFPTAPLFIGTYLSSANGGIDPMGMGSGDFFMLVRSDDGSSNSNYGWISFTSVFTDNDNGLITVTGWGWSDDGTPIAAGQTGGGGAVPGLGGLAALACGASGVRRKRSRVA